MGESMTRTDLRTYTPEFRAEAVKVVLEQGLSLEATAQRLSVPKGTLANWVKTARRGSMTPTSPPGSRSVAELEYEIAKLRRELAVERMEKEVLKKATAYFARESLPGTRS
jgi:transposase